MRVEIDRSAIKDLTKVPHYIKEKLYQWIERVEEFGIDEVRKIKGFHDEPLKGDRVGQRSIRLNRSYRAIYKESTEKVEIVIIIEVHNHDY